MITLGSLFSGIGGLDLGMERAGLTVRWQAENEPFCRKVLKQHWPKVKRYGDVRRVKWEEAEHVDCVCGGFPCPPVSVAGLRKGDTDERWLWPEFERCLRTVRPRWVVVENVRGLLSSHSGREFTEILRGLSDLGYDAEWGLISAASVGAPHRRERVFILAHSQRFGRGGGSAGCGESGGAQPQVEVTGRCGELADTKGGKCYRRLDTRGGRAGPSDDGADKYGELPEWPPGPEERKQWAEIIQRWPELAPALQVKSGVCRMVAGVSYRVDRLRALGNSVVPMVAEVVGRMIVSAERANPPTA